MSQDQTNAPRWAANTTEAERAYFAAENVAQATRRARLLVRDIINQRAPVIAPVSADEVAEVTQAVNFVVAYCRRTEDLSPLRTLRDDVDAWGWLMAWASTEAEREDVAADAVAMMMGEPSPPTAEAARLSELAEAVAALYIAMETAAQLPTEIRITQAQAEANRVADDAPRMFEPLRDNRLISKNGSQAAQAARLLFDRLTDNHYIDPQPREAQAKTWLYLWGVGEYPRPVVKINWVAHVGLLASMMDAITPTRKGRHETTAKAFDVDGETPTPKQLKTALKAAKDAPPKAQAERADTLTALINSVIGNKN